MSQWETIHDKSSYISPVRISSPKNHSTERLEKYFEAMSRSPVKPSVDESNSKAEHKRERTSATRVLMVTSMLVCILISLCFYSCRTMEHNNIITCNYVNTLSSKADLLGATVKDNAGKKSKEWLDHYYQAAEPYIDKVQSSYRWAETTSVKSAIEQTQQIVRPLIYTEENQIRIVESAKALHYSYIVPCWIHLWEYVTNKSIQLRQQLSDYVNSGSTSRPPTEDNDNNLVVEDRLKKTAKRILDYIDQIKENSERSGMKQEEAKEKAQEIIKSVKDATTSNIHLREPFDSVDDVSRVAFEIQSILDLADTEKQQLDEQLDLIQLQLQELVITDDEEDQFLLSALKAEVDGLRATAENNVRARAKLALENTKDMSVNHIIKNRIKDDIRAAQRAALKDLRQVYIKLYQTNKHIDTLASMSS